VKARIGAYVVEKRKRICEKSAPFSIFSTFWRVLLQLVFEENQDFAWLRVHRKPKTLPSSKVKNFLEVNVFLANDCDVF